MRKGSDVPSCFWQVSKVSVNMNVNLKMNVGKDEAPLSERKLKPVQHLDLPARRVSISVPTAPTLAAGQ
jgi:hypothetical protein